MYQKNGCYHYSPSDLTCYMGSAFASWMNRYALECPQHAPDKDPPDALMSLLQKQGYEHEDALQRQFIEQGCSLIDLSNSENKEAATRAAMQSGVDVIVQGYLNAPPFSGYADFLVKVTGASSLGDYHYEVWDTKLSSTVKPSFIIQLCCYADMLDAIQGVRPAFITVALGNGEQVRLKTDDYFYYYLSLKKSFLAAQARFDSEQQPDPADSKNWGNWNDYAERVLIEHDHLSQVATITRNHIKKLNTAGIHTMTALVNSSASRIPSMNTAIFSRLKAQAAIQQQSRGKEIPLFHIIPHEQGEKRGLALLPPYSANDVFFDIEGYPLDEGGLEYLWGNTYFNPQGERVFKDFWAHNREQEKATFAAFIAWVYAIWQRDPTMHIYHYASYEITACRKLMGRYGICEHEVDELLRNEVFVDLYNVVKGCMLLGEPRYSIKNVEHLYRGKRQTEVGNGGDSVVVYENWRTRHANGEEGDTWQTSKILNDIRDYNIDDCDSTQELVDWLREQQAIHCIAFLGKEDAAETELNEDVVAKTELRDRLLLRSENERSEGLPQHAALTENMAWMLEFHRREAKPVFWRLFESLGMSHEALFDQLDCLACCERTERESFKAKPRARNLAYEYTFDTAQEFKGANRSFYVLGEEDEEGHRIKAAFVSDESDLKKGIIVVQSKHELPPLLSLIPDEYVNPRPIPQAIEAVVQAYEQNALGRCAVLDFLQRKKPVIAQHDGTAIAPSHDPATKLQQIIHAAQYLDHSYLTIQGPPGAGKSYTGKHIIAELLKAGKKVGISSNSHKAINHLLLSTAIHCEEENITAFFACTRETDSELVKHGVTILKSNAKLALSLQPATVVGTTAWGFARADMVGTLDYLFIDEAGQVSVANLVAMSRAAQNIILMGDQMQLGQPSQGTHPAASGLSILDYLLHENPTIPDDMGVFLDTTYRMHSAVNQFISTHIYEGRLASFRGNDTRRICVPEDYRGALNKEAGIIFVPVEHHGNSQASDEEVAAIVAMRETLLGREFVTANGTRPVGLDDIMIIAPYNHQVNKLQQALGDTAKVGSVDKFQGQEAPIVFLSMCASDANESPRGMEFLFDRHRINVAVSRAQCLVIVVASPMLANTTANRVEQLRLINLFNALVAAGE